MVYADLALEPRLARFVGSEEGSLLAPDGGEPLGRVSTSGIGQLNVRVEATSARLQRDRAERLYQSGVRWP